MLPVGDDDTANVSYPLFHYEDIQRRSNDTMPSDHELSTITSTALQKNLSTTKTPFLPSEHSQPEEWPKIVGGIFLAFTVSLIIATIIRKVRESNKRKDYEEIQSLVV